MIITAHSSSARCNQAHVFQRFHQHFPHPFIILLCRTLLMNCHQGAEVLRKEEALQQSGELRRSLFLLTTEMRYKLLAGRTFHFQTFIGTFSKLESENSNSWSRSNHIRFFSFGNCAKIQLFDERLVCWVGKFYFSSFLNENCKMKSKQIT